MRTIKKIAKLKQFLDDFIKNMHIPKRLAIGLFLITIIAILTRNVFWLSEAMYPNLIGMLITVVIIEQAFRVQEERKIIPLKRYVQERLESFANLYCLFFAIYGQCDTSRIDSLEEEQFDDFWELLCPSMYIPFRDVINNLYQQSRDILLLYSDGLEPEHKVNLLGINNYAEEILNTLESEAKDIDAVASLETAPSGVLRLGPTAPAIIGHLQNIKRYSP